MDYDRYLAPRIKEALVDTPVVWVRGARQVGKTTLAQAVSESDGTAITFDDNVTLKVALNDPDSFVLGLPERVLLDEVQRVPELFRSIKLAVDKRRSPGRFLLTGSANVFALPKASESLAGRMETYTLEPLAQAEVRATAGTFLDVIYGEEPLPAMPQDVGLTKAELWSLIAVGGYPEALLRTNPARRDRFFESYTSTLLDRDLRDISEIGRPLEMPKLLELLAARSGGLFNRADLGRALGIPDNTLKRYLALLEALFIYRPLPAWHTNTSTRLAKAPKVHLVDTGLAAHVLGITDGALPEQRVLGGLCESFVVNELYRLASWQARRVRLYHFRTTAGVEVDLVLETPQRGIVGVEVKSGRNLSPKDFRGLRALQEAAGDRFRRGVILYAGDQTLSYGDGLWAVPIPALWLW